MIAASAACCDVSLLPFLKTLFDITLLRKGPQHLPRSPVTLLLASVFWLFAVLLSQVALFGLSSERLIMEVALLFLALSIYYAVLVGFGKSTRVGQCISAILGAGAMVLLLFVVSTLFFWRFLGQAGVQFAVGAFMIWSVCVKGHIIAKGLDRPWFFGAMLACVILFLQWAVGDFLAR